MSVPEAGREAFGLGRSASYQAAQRGDLPVIAMGRKKVVATAALRRLLCLDEPAEFSGHEEQASAPSGGIVLPFASQRSPTRNP